MNEKILLKHFKKTTGSKVEVVKGDKGYNIKKSWISYQ